MARITDTPAPQGLPCAQGGLEPARAAVVRGGSTSMRTATMLNLHEPDGKGKYRFILSSLAPWLVRDSGFIAILTKIGLVGQGCTRQRKQTPRAPSLRVLRVSARIRPAHAEARRRGERAQVLQGLSDGAAPVAGNERFTCHLEAAPWGARHAVPPHPSLEVGVSRDTADPTRGQCI